MTCPHEIWTIEPDTFRCKRCGVAIDAPPIGRTIAAIRDLLATKRYRPTPVAVEPAAPPPPIPRKDP